MADVKKILQESELEKVVGGRATLKKFVKAVIRYPIKAGTMIAGVGCGTIVGVGGGRLGGEFLGGLSHEYSDIDFFRNGGDDEIRLTLRGVNFIKLLGRGLAWFDQDNGRKYGGYVGAASGAVYGIKVGSEIGDWVCEFLGVNGDEN